MTTLIAYTDVTQNPPRIVSAGISLDGVPVSNDKTRVPIPLCSLNVSVSLMARHINNVYPWIRPLLFL